MFEKLFAESGLSLDRLRAFLAVGAAGSIVKATGGDPVKQSQYSRQIKELEDFFRSKLVEKQGKVIRLSANGKELARISRFFLLGLSNFQRGCLAEEQSFCIGASATFLQQFLLPVVSGAAVVRSDTRYIVESVVGDDIERRLHDLTLDFGITTRAAVSRPLQLKELGRWKLGLWIPARVQKDAKSAAAAFKDRSLPVAFATKEFEAAAVDEFVDQNNRVTCDSFFQAIAALKSLELGAVLPEFLAAELRSKEFVRVRIPGLDSRVFHFRLVWNPRLFRLNPHAAQRKDFLVEALTRAIKGSA